MTTQQMLDERYGLTRSARARRVRLVVVGVAGTVAVAALAWSTWVSAADAVHADVTGFDLVDSHRVTVSFQVTAPVGEPIACALEAQDTEHGVVGWKVVEYPASADPARAMRETIPTVAAATTGLVNSCWVI